MSNIVIYGAGTTGMALKSLLEDDNVIIFDDDQSKSQVTSVDFSQIQLVITSPGVLPDTDFLHQCRNHGIVVMGELQFCYQRCKNKIISVTGTNGKTTVTQLIKHMLDACCQPNSLLGNGGVAFSKGLPQLSDNQVVVLESSSFQLKDCFDFSPDVSVFTNLAPDHLDYHKTYQSYVDAKLNNFLHQDESNIAIFNLDDKQVVQCSGRARAQKLFYSTSQPCDCYYLDGYIVVNGNKKIDYKNNLAQHNLSNVLCALLCVSSLGLDVECAVKSIETFVFDQHRMQLLAKVKNVCFIDDSKATNIHAVNSALHSIDGDVCLILGGVDKGLDFYQLFNNNDFAKVKFVACIGQTADKILQISRLNGVDCIKCNSLQDATKCCYQKAMQFGGTVLLSPACSSFDMFDNYKQRGLIFQQCVKELNNAW